MVGQEHELEAEWGEQLLSDMKGRRFQLIFSIINVVDEGDINIFDDMEVMVRYEEDLGGRKSLTRMLLLYSEDVLEVEDELSVREEL